MVKSYNINYLLIIIFCNHDLVIKEERVRDWPQDPKVYNIILHLNEMG